MKAITSIIVAGLLTLLLFVAPAFADSVETWDGLLFEGTIIAGMPDVLSLDDNGVSVSIRQKAALDIAFTEGSEVVRVTTTTGKTFEDRLLSSIGTITIRTSSGETEIAPDQIRRLRFPYKQSESPMYANSVYLLDGRAYKGTLTASFPEKISIDVGGITSSVFTDSIITLKFGDPSSIETTERTYQGTIISNLPQAIEMETKFGGLAINRTDIASMTFSPEPVAPVGQAGFGIGAKFIGSAPLLFVTAKWGSIGVEGGLGFSSGALVFEGHGKYSVRLLDDTFGFYIGAGFLGVTVGGIALSGFEALGGIDLSFYQLLGFPASVFAGAGWWMGTAPIWHFGLRWDL
jgi:hypothetical protein